MLDCLILGDSIAVGVSQYRPECQVKAEVGISSTGYNEKFGIVTCQANTVIISLGSNDSSATQTAKGSLKLRNSIDADRVIWIIPPEIRNDKKFMIIKVAMHFNDVILDIPSSYVGPDHVHPTNEGYKYIANMAK